jgi:hypothetical protein
LVKAFSDKPVKFIAVGANDNFSDVSAYVAQTRIAMPIFADNLGLMQSRYGMKISLQNITQIRVIDPAGNIVAQRLDEATLNRVIEETKPAWKYKDKGYDAKLAQAVEAFEWGQYAAGLKLLSTPRRSPNKALAGSANMLYTAVKEEVAKWKEEADGLAASDPIKAYDLYQKIAASLPGDALAKTASAAAGKLAREKAVAAELAARKVYNLTEAGLARMVPQQKKQAATSFEAIAKKYGTTPTGEKAAALAKELAQ